MNEMTLSSRDRLRNSSPGGLRPARYLSVTEAPHNIESLRVSRKEALSLLLERQSGVRTRDLRLVKQAALTNAPGPPLFMRNNTQSCVARGWVESLQNDNQHPFGQSCMPINNGSDRL